MSRSFCRAALIFVFITQASPPSIAADTELPLPVRRVLANRNLPAESLSIVVEELGTGRTVLTWNADVPRNPASVEKMVTTLAALDILGPTYRWNTDIYLLGELKDGVLDGDILIRGTGDPFLVTEQFWQMLRDLRQHGVRKIDGDLLIDDSYFDVPAYDPAAFDSQPLRAYNVGPNALLTNLKVVRYIFEPDPGSNTVNVRMDPPLPDLMVRNQLKLTPGRCSGYQRGVSIHMNDSLDQVTFSGRFPSGCRIYALDRTALGHNEFAFSLFKSLWTEIGGEFSGTWRNVRTPEELLPDITHRSLTLAEIISKVNKNSNNVMARHLLYTLGAEKKGLPATEDSGRAVIIDWLQQRGVATDTINVANGAGLSRDTRLTSRMLVDLLRFAYDSPFMPEYLSSLAVSGLDGTLSRRYQNSNMTGKAHMKTGSLDHVMAIAGYFQAESGKRYLVAAMQNYPDVHRGPGEEVQTAVLSWLNGR